MYFLTSFIIASLAISWASPWEPPVDYTGHKVITVFPSNGEQLEIIKQLVDKHQLDLWTEPRVADAPLMIRLQPDTIEEVEQSLKDAKIPFEVAIYDLQSAIESEKIANAPSLNPDERISYSDAGLDRYFRLSEINQFLQNVALTYPGIVATINIGTTYENRPIMGAKVGSDESKPVILIECGIHAREWVSVSSCLYTINELAGKYATDSSIQSLVNNYQWYIIPSSNPDGYLHSWNRDRMWRKTRSRSRYNIDPRCMGADANRNFDIQHCGVGTSKNPCEDIYCGDAPFSENESRALRDLILSLGSRIKAYFAVHAFSQLWMTPYGYTKDLPPNYNQLMSACKAGIDALRNVHGTNFKCGSISNIIYPASGSSIDLAYDKAGVKNSFALELRDTGVHGFMLPNHLIIPTCEETFAGLVAAIRALN